jgi:nitroimidazol reductase NimA-like FMN-containing flavoprotein (pyridoxamine 5'-phosphate oxidase superfamily)
VPGFSEEDVALRPRALVQGSFDGAPGPKDPSPDDDHRYRFPLMEELDTHECEKLLDEGLVAHLATVAEGEPYVTPLSYVYMDGALYFRSGPGRRLDALRRHPRVCVEVSRFDTDTGDWESVLAWGYARLIEDPQLGSEVVARLFEKYRPVMGSAVRFSLFEPVAGFEALLEVRPERLSGRSSGKGLSPRTRPGRL